MKNLNKINLFVILFMLFALITHAQKSEVTPLFQKENAIEAKMSFSIKDVKKITNDTVYTPSVLHYKNESGTWDSLKIDIRARGNFRRANCFFPPIRIKIKKKDSEGTLFEGNKSLKLVLPCQNAKTAGDLIMKEYLCYQLYEPLTPYYFNTRLVNLTLTDQSGKNPKSYDVKAFIIEDDDLVAKRFNAEISEVQLHPLRLHDTTSTIHDFFEYMISNTDWSSVAQHNIKVMQLASKEYLPLTYDFDMSGIVNAPYATVSEQLAISSVRERVYRGFCRNDALFEYVRSLYLKRESEIMKAINSVGADINPKDVAGIQKYLGEFFSTLKNDKNFKDNILSKCRTQ